MAVSKSRKENIEDIWARFYDKLKSFILARISDEAGAEDILQEVFIKIHSSIDTLRDETRMQSWVYQITRNAMVDYIRSTQKGIPASDFPDESADPDPPEPMAEALQDMAKMMDELSPEDCEALCLTELGKMSQKDYAQMIGISYSGAKSRIQRAKKKLRDMMMLCCHYQFDAYGTVIDISPRNCCCCN